MFRLYFIVGLPLTVILFSLGTSYLMAECPETCKLAASRGPCQRSKNLIKNRWYYDSMENKCNRFIYGGCGGNENKFLKLEECQIVCEQRCQDGPHVTDVRLDDESNLLQFNPGHFQDFERS